MFPHPSTALAAVFHGVANPHTLEEFPLPALSGSEALVRIRCATICGSDLHTYFGRRSSPLPGILGHEMVGEIVAVGPDGIRDPHGNGLNVGERVTWSMVWSCGDCYYCRHGLRCKCERLMKFGHEALAPGRELLGGLAEYCFLPEKTAIFAIPPNVTDRVACPANCATATVAAIFRHAGPVTGETVVVHGAGMLGLTACAMASVRGAGNIVVLEPDAARRATALRFGATLALDGALPGETLRAHLASLTGGRGADLGIELSGFPEAVECGLGLLRPGGRFLLAGATFPARPCQWPAEQIVRRMLQITGVYNYQPEDLRTALDFLAQAQGRFPFEELVGAAYPLCEVDAAFAFASEQRPPRVALIPHSRVHGESLR